MLTHDELVKKALEDPEVRAEYERIEREEMPMLDTILKARSEAGLTQAQVAERMGIKVAAVARLENSLITGEHFISISTLKKYAAALGWQGAGDSLQLKIWWKSAGLLVCIRCSDGVQLVSAWCIADVSAVFPGGTVGV